MLGYAQAATCETLSGHETAQAGWTWPKLSDGDFLLWLKCCLLNRIIGQEGLMSDMFEASRRLLFVPLVHCREQVVEV